MSSVESDLKVQTGQEDRATSLTYHREAAKGGIAARRSGWGALEQG
jgi:hypothetical protein